MENLKALLPINEQWLGLAVQRTMVTEPELLAAVTVAQGQRSDIASVLLEAKKLTPEQIASLKAEAAQVPDLDVSDYELDPEALKWVPESVARKHQVLPLYSVSGTVTVAIADPWDVMAIDTVRKCARVLVIHCVVATPQAIAEAIERHYGRQVVESAAQRRVAAPGPRVDEKTVGGKESVPAETVDDVSIAKLMDGLFGEAVGARASDIHLEPDGEHTRLRFRIDGVMQEVKLFPIGLHEPMCSRIKLLAKLDIAEHRLPQDGHLSIMHQGRPVELRVSTYPTVSGENLVVRLLDSSSGALRLKDLGFAEDTLAQVEALIRQPHGMLLATGPTGSGKTTSLYGVLAQIDARTKNVMTIEDPVEYHLPMIRQTQINVKAGLTFASGLRSVLRQDPDVIMVGEIRDRETAQITVHAALTGHLVLSTVHTNDAPSAITRLIDLGVEPHLLSSTLLGVLAQRLMRRICPGCQEGFRSPKDVHVRYPQMDVMYRGRGCRQCRQSGFLGRVGVFELLTINEAIRTHITATCSSDSLKREAIKEGMRTMRNDGLLKVQQGQGTLAELDRILPTGESA